MKAFALLVLLALPAVFPPAAFAQAAESGGPGDYIVSRDTPAWFKPSFLDFGEDAAEAAENGRRVMIYFGQDGCPYCKKLHQDSFKNPEIVGFLNQRFDAVAVNIFGDVEAVWTDGAELTEKELAAKLGIQFTPTLLFLDERENEIVRVAGYQPPHRLRAVLDYAARRLDLQGKSLESHMREAAAKHSARPAPPPQNFAPPKGRLNAPGKRSVVFVSQGGCEICAEWRDYLSQNAGKWGAKFQLFALNRFGENPAAKTESESESESEWARRMKVSFAPALIFLNADGSEFFRADGYLRAFHLDSVLDYAAAGAAAAEPEFQRFLRRRADRLRERGEEVRIW